MQTEVDKINSIKEELGNISKELKSSKFFWNPESIENCIKWLIYLLVAAAIHMFIIYYNHITDVNNILILLIPSFYLAFFAFTFIYYVFIDEVPPKIVKWIIQLFNINLTDFNILKEREKTLRCELAEEYRKINPNSSTSFGNYSSKTTSKTYRKSTTNYTKAPDETGLFTRERQQTPPPPPPPPLPPPTILELVKPLDQLFSTIDQRINISAKGEKAHKINEEDRVEKTLNDISIGLLGERFVIECEKEYLIKKGRKDLAEKIEHTAIVQGDGLGYDIISYNLDGEKKHIEVKTTSQNFESSFFLTATELDRMRNLKNHFLYRVYNFDSTTGKGSIFIIEGSLELQFYFNSEAVKYIITPKKR